MLAQAARETRRHELESMDIHSNVHGPPSRRARRRAGFFIRSWRPDGPGQTQVQLAL
jgi:hypothetical protein